MTKNNLADQYGDSRSMDPITQEKQSTLASEMAMTGLARVDPALRDFLETFPPVLVNAENLATVRARMRGMLSLMPPVNLSGMTRWEASVPGLNGAPSVRVICYRPETAEEPLPTILHIHGGGMVTGMPEMNEDRNARLSRDLRCNVVSVDYRLAPEATAPENVEDCYAVLDWLHGAPAGLNVAASRIGVLGESAGGGLAVALCLMARDLGQRRISFQVLISPMLDDQTGRDEQVDGFGDYIWPKESNDFGWSALLGGKAASPYAVPARAEDLAGLPRTFISVGALDLFFREDVAFAVRLANASVPIELHVYPGAYHGFEMVSEASIAQKASSNCLAAIKAYLQESA